MPPGKRVFIGVPGQKHTLTAVWDDLGECFANPDNWGKHKVAFRANSTSGHLDMARTMLLRQGLAWRADYIAQKDADVVVENSFLETMSFLAQDFSQGAGLVFSPTTAMDWRAQFTPLPGHSQSEYDMRSPFEAESGAGGFMVMTAEVVAKLKVLGVDHYSFGTESGHAEPIGLLCVNRPAFAPGESSVSEDVSLMRNVRDSTGLKVVCDPRILTAHLPPAYRPSARPVEKIPPGAFERMMPPVLFRALIKAGVLKVT